jgi:hypothetical protein
VTLFSFTQFLIFANQDINLGDKEVVPSIVEEYENANIKLFLEKNERSKPPEKESRYVSHDPRPFILLTFVTVGTVVPMDVEDFVVFSDCVRTKVLEEPVNTLAFLSHEVFFSHKPLPFAICSLLNYFFPLGVGWDQVGCHHRVQFASFSHTLCPSRYRNDHLWRCISFECFVPSD